MAPGIVDRFKSLTRSKTDDRAECADLTSGDNCAKVLTM